MQTFLPYSDFRTSAEVLDRPRLGKQRVETLQLLKARLMCQEGWTNVPWSRHPACKMWEGYEYQLLLYGMEICREWRNRGYRDSVEASLLAMAPRFPVLDPTKPHWLGDEAFHLSHQSNLLRKNPDYYGVLWAGISPDLPYVWPAGRFG